MKCILFILLLATLQVTLAKHKMHYKKKNAKTNTLESQKSLLANQLMRDRQTISLVKKIQEKINQKLKKSKLNKGTNTIKKIMPLLDKTADFFKSNELLIDDEEKKNLTVQEQFSQLLNRLKDDKQESYIKDMQSQLQDVLHTFNKSKNLNTTSIRFSQSQSQGETKIVNENNSGLKLVEQQQNKILEQEQVISSLRQMQEKFEQKLNQEEQKIKNLSIKENAIVQITAPKPSTPNPTPTPIPTAPITVIAPSPTVVNDTDEQMKAIAKHNQEVYEYEQIAHQKAQLLLNQKTEQAQRDQEFIKFHQKITATRQQSPSQSVYEEVQKYENTAPAVTHKQQSQQEYVQIEKNTQKKQPIINKTSMKYDESTVVIKKNFNPQTDQFAPVQLNAYHPFSPYHEPQQKLSSSSEFTHVQTQQQVPQQVLKQQLQMVTYKQSQTQTQQQPQQQTQTQTQTPKVQQFQQDHQQQQYAQAQSSYQPLTQQRFQKLQKVSYKTVESNTKKEIKDKYETVSYYKPSVQDKKAPSNKN